ncbi:hypothetical protein SUDANB140_00193 [Streptomyces sp. enrichment culture]
MVVLTRRQRLVAAGAAVGVDVALWLVRWAVGAETNFGNGALWVVLGCAVVAVTRRTGGERTLLLKGAGLGLLLVAGHKTGDTWLLITSETRGAVLDPYVATADHALGAPSWLMLPVEMAAHPWAAGPLLVLAMVLVVLGHVRTTRAWEREDAPAVPEPPQPARPRPELV